MSVTTVAPVLLGEASDFATVRDWLVSSGFTEAALCERLAIDSIHDFRTLQDGRTTGTSLDDALDLAVRLFLDTEPLDEPTLSRYLPATCRKALDHLGLLQRLPGGTYSTVLLYPTEGFYCISDHVAPPSGAPALGADVVYPAVTHNTRTFLQFLPRTGCERFLEVCGGTGIAALAATRFAGSAVTTDVTARAAHFATFNGRLNGLENFTSVQGDMYTALGDRQFDLIAAHPPYVPADGNDVIFRDGGSDGEELIRRAVVEGVPRLAHGGMLYLTCVASDRKDGRFEERLRLALGPAGAEVDILVLTRFEESPVEYRVRSLLAVRASLASIDRYAAQVRSLGVDALVYAHVYIVRRSGGAGGATLRRRLGRQTTPDDVAWALKVAGMLADGSTRRTLLDRKARANPWSAVIVRYGFVDEWVPVEATQSADHPFTVAVRGPVWVADLVRLCDGSRTLREAMGVLGREGVLEADLSEERLLELAASFVSNGTLELEGMPALRPPTPDPRRDDNFLTRRR